MDVEYIRCGSRHCLFILFNGDCYLCGSDSNGQCNFTQSNELKDVLYPDPQLNGKKIKNGWCGDSHTVIYSVDNELIAFGAVKFNWNRNEHKNVDIKDNEYIVRVLPTHNATFLVVCDNNNDIKN